MTRALPLFRMLSVLPAAAILSACVSVLPEAAPPSARYTLQDVDVDLGAREPVEWTLSIDDPTSTRAYDTTKIALLRERARIEYYASGEWVDRAPRLFGAALIRTFENTERILGVGTRSNQPLSNYILQTDIRAFHADYSEAGRKAEVYVFARLTDNRGRIFASKLFKQDVKLQTDSVMQAAYAIDEGVSQNFQEIVPWVFEQASARYAK